MERLSPKGDKSIEAVPLGRMGDGGKSIFSIDDLVRSGLLTDIECPSFVSCGYLGISYFGICPMHAADEIATMGMFLFSKAATWITGQIFVSTKMFHAGRSFLVLLGYIGETGLRARYTVRGIGTA
jgi:hypothetical protein